MRCYTDHKRTIRFIKIMSHMSKTICIYPSSILLEMCSEANLSEPVYVDISKERFMFQFSVQLKIRLSSTGGTADKTTATGFSFHDKSDAAESAALAALDVLIYHHGIRSVQYNDLVFVQHWPAYNHMSENFKDTTSAVLGLISETSSLIARIGESGLLFEAEKCSFNGDPGNSHQIGTLDDCQAELCRIYNFFSADISEHREEIRRRCPLNRFYNQNYYKELHALHKDLDTKLECINTLKLTLDSVAERTGYSVGLLSSKCISENSYMTEILFTKEFADTDCEKCLRVSSATCNNISESQCSAMCRAIDLICLREGFKIVDPGYLDFRDMRRESCALKHEVPLLCDVITKIKSIVQNGFRSIDVLSQQYYRELKGPSFSKELRLSLADCISDFIYIIKSFDEEIKKMEMYSSNLSSHGRGTDIV